MFHALYQGTLTQNEQTVTQVFASTGDTAHLTGLGFSADGEVIIEGVPLSASTGSNVKKVLEVGLLCNNAHISADGKLFGILLSCVMTFPPGASLLDGQQSETRFAHLRY